MSIVLRINFVVSWFIVKELILKKIILIDIEGLNMG